MKRVLIIVLTVLLSVCLFGCENHEVQMVNCRNCNEQIEETVKFCPNCGKSQDGASDSASDAGNENSQNNTNENTEQTKNEAPVASTCVKCGATCEINHSYCSSHECSYSHCLLPTKSGSNYCDSHACLLCKKVRSTGSAYCTAHVCSNCNNASVGSSKFCAAHKCMLCDKEAWSNGYCSKHKP